MRRMRFLFLVLVLICTGQADEADPTNTTEDDGPALTTPITTPLARIANKPEEPTLVTVTKCCPDKHSLDVSNPQHPTCVIAADAVSPFTEIRGLVLDSNNVAQEVEIKLTQDSGKPFAIPPCSSDFEVHIIKDAASVEIRDTWVTVNGKLVTSRYEAEFDHGEFCVDRDIETHDIVAVMCDACKQGIPCINMCCPHGHAFVDNPDFDYDDYNSPFKFCQKKKGLSYNPVLWDHNDKVFLQTWEKNNHFLVVGTKHIPNNTVTSHSFECPPVPDGKEEEGLSWAPTDLGTFRILINGNLQGKDIKNKATQEKETRIWNSENFCVVFGTSPDYSYDSENDTSTEKKEIKEAEFTYMTCHGEKISWCEEFTVIFHPIVLSISTIFLILTLLVYLCEDNLRRTNPLFSRITIGFISNLTVCFIVLVDNYAQQLDGERRETFSCILSGYLVLYFFLGFFFWINTMSFNIWLKFTYMSMQNPSPDEERRKFWKYLTYAQGMPLLICVITALVDATGNGEGNAENLIHRPNMGKYTCFVGAVKTSFDQSYFGRPEFIYFQSFIMLLQIANMFFLGATVHSLYKGWQNQAKLLKITGKDQENDLKAKFQKLKDQLAIVVRLFIIMGVPWILELVSSAIAAEHGFDETCTVRLCIDMANLLAGVLIFLVIVAKKPVILSLKAKASGITSSIYPSQASSLGGNTKATDIELKSVSVSESSK
eukprot:GFUD01033514.1.p1 GENE.GFUD01033514.1~~GFUD01033514.1.p1  ORF type:complete len:712 (+),score=129.88 GFUD01033514.1:89-2224(+)